MNSPSLDSVQIARVLKPYAALTAEQLAKTRTYLELLLKWNARVNLTAVRDAKQIAARHFGESFFAADRLLAPDWQGTVIDVGSGAGFPGVPIAMWAPQTDVTLIESNGKKAAFLNEVIRALELKNVHVASQRAEAFPQKAQLVTMRAVERFESSLLLALKLVQRRGRIGLMIGKDQVAGAQEAGQAFAWAEPVPVPGGHSRVLLVGTNQVNVGKTDGLER